MVTAVVEGRRNRLAPWLRLERMRALAATALAIWITHSLGICRSGSFVGAGGAGGKRSHRYRRASVQLSAGGLGGLGDLLGNMPKMMEGMKKLPELQQKLKVMASTGSALEGRITVTVTGDLAPVSVQIDETLMKEVSEKELSAGVLIAMRVAHEASVELTRSKMAEFYSDLGVPVPGALGGKPEAGSPPKPALPTEASTGAQALDFDPIGLR